MKWINENLYISPINTYIDPSKPVENAIITHGHADHAKPGHKNVLATKETINIMKIRYGENCAQNFQELTLNKTLKKTINDESKIIKFKNDLKNINLKLWDIEDGKRSAEKNKKFDEEFIELARNVYKFNDERARIKLAINNTLGSNIKEVKSYE